MKPSCLSVPKPRSQRILCQPKSSVNSLMPSMHRVVGEQMPSTSSLPTLKAPPLSFRSINSSKIPTMLGNSTKLSLVDRPKREDEKRKRRVLRRLRSRIYFYRDNDYSFSKKKKADFIRRSVFLLVDFRSLRISTN